MRFITALERLLRHALNSLNELNIHDNSEDDEHQILSMRAGLK